MIQHFSSNNLKRPSRFALCLSKGFNSLCAKHILMKFAIFGLASASVDIMSLLGAWVADLLGVQDQ